ncbi:MAG: hypothetical protein EPN80_02890 [Pandoraea sp.]|nr:MAG: hypothetical protein EPN80_02890 [Pandoraea sp.]TAM15368.1 MAG: hypothetical protein EPN65_18660 [Pandoraea sp.]
MNHFTVPSAIQTSPNSVTTTTHHRNNERIRKAERQQPFSPHRLTKAPFLLSYRTTAECGKAP